MSEELLSVQPVLALDGRLATVIENLGLPWGSTVENVVVLLLVSASVYLVGRLILKYGVGRVLSSREVDRHLQVMILRSVHVLIIAIAFGCGLFVSGYTFFLGALVAGLAAGGLSVGMALQGAVRNVVAGILIYVEKPFRIDDEIEWNGNAGTVEDINLRVTRVRSFDNKMITVPNSQLTDGIMQNPVIDGPLRLDVDFPIDLKADVEEAKQIILEEADAVEDVLEDPEPAVLLVDFEESRLRLQARVWVANRNIGDRVGIRDAFTTAVKSRLEDEGFEIPYPHRRVSNEPVEGEGRHSELDSEDSESTVEFDESEQPVESDDSESAGESAESEQTVEPSD